MKQPSEVEMQKKGIEHLNGPRPPERPQPMDVATAPQGTISGASFVPKPNSPDAQGYELQFFGVLNRSIPFEFTCRCPDAEKYLVQAFRSMQACSLEKELLASALLQFFQAGLFVTGCERWNGRTFEPLCVEMLVTMRCEGATFCVAAVRAALAYAVDEAGWLIPEGRDQSVRFSPHGREYAKVWMASVAKSAPGPASSVPEGGDGAEYCISVPSLGSRAVVYGREAYEAKLAEILENLRGREAKIEVTRTPRDFEDAGE